MLVMMILMLVIIMIMISFVDDKGVPKNFFLILHFFQPECQMVYREYLSEIFVAYLLDTPQKIQICRPINKEPPALFSFTLHLQWGNQAKMRCW